MKSKSFQVFSNGKQDMSCPQFLAVKRMTSGNPTKLQRDWCKELKALERLKDCRHPHIVRFVTGICLRNKDDADYYLIFEWADGGNLRNLWETNRMPRLSVSLVKEICEQLRGLAGALKTAHYLEDDGNSNIRHGDLKPSNILWFKTNDGIGTLKIADWGLAKENEGGTELRELRNHGTTALYGTKRYEAPEIGAPNRKETLYLDVQDNPRPVNTRSRLCDIWSMGCICLEFVIWLFYGYDGYHLFKIMFEEKEPLFQTGNSTTKIHPVAEKWIDHISRNPLCNNGTTALGKLVELIRNRLLVITLPPHKGNKMPSPLDLSSHDGPSLGPELTVTTTDPNPIHQGLTRILSTDFEAEMEKISETPPGMKEEDYWPINAPQTPLALPQELLQPPASIYGTQSVGGALNEPSQRLQAPVVVNVKKPFQSTIKDAD